jgi:hypothetical protein
VISYQEFLRRKTQNGEPSGFDPDTLPDFLFPFQRDLTAWALHQGRGAIFADCGLGKSPMQLAWADTIRRRTGKPVLIVTPLAVAAQTEREADKFGFDAAVSRLGQIPAAITITNYERLEHFDPAKFGGVVCDESSAIKAFDGRRRAIVTEFLRTLPYRLLCTATAAPNDYIELGTSSEALGHLGRMDMLNRFFTNKQKNSSTGRGFKGAQNEWRFKGHAETSFWRWVNSWARAMRKPSDLGYSDAGFALPALEYRLHTVEPPASTAAAGILFDDPGGRNRGGQRVNRLHEERAEMRRTLTERCEAAAAALTDADPGVAWCHLNDESALLTKLIEGAVEVRGSDHPDAKEEKLLAFGAGKIRVLVTKPSIGGWGLNWQHCHRMSFFPSHSYEQWYQSVRRSWRFGQENPVVVDVITTPGTSSILDNLQRKTDQANRMFDALVTYMRDGIIVDPTVTFNHDMEIPAWLAS